ncbi:hypothetical protein DL89DRAFT_139912 [Linderina pennispora]|uniref:Uncharacterized protein n=1 Tax=Linderina pennispora TaxID=61395 RepID=A0A1Y1WB59_9FUNG|nr:uncharacterized protein DL89DRAFT_139912 [Linderina pennispora]ORX70763.1 hypothetical protein DL89DRAFT_139912 [Linderina pennispora]
MEDATPPPGANGLRKKKHAPCPTPRRHGFPNLPLSLLQTMAICRKEAGQQHVAQSQKGARLSNHTLLRETAQRRALFLGRMRR